MGDDKHLMAVRLDQDDYDWLKTRAEALTGGNTSLALRRIVKAAREAEQTSTQPVSRVIRERGRVRIQAPSFTEPNETSQPAKKPRSEPPPMSDKLAYQRWQRENKRSEPT